MKYIINMTITFVPDERVLIFKDESQLSIILSKPATRLLIEFISNQRKDLTREDLIDNVWANHGFSPSNASLSNHISELRKAFESVGEDNEIIVTIPRVGFRMDADVHTVTKEDDELKALQLVSNTPIDDYIEKYDSGSNKVNIIKKHSTKIIALTVIMLSIVIAGITFSIKTVKKNVTPRYTLYGKCKVYSPENSKDTVEFTNKVIKKIAIEKIDCSHGNFDIFYIEARPTNERLKVNLMGVCTLKNDITYQTCMNYKLVD